MRIFKLLILMFVFTSCVAKAKQDNFLRHNVLKGETIYHIARKYQITPFDIYRLNPDSSQSLLKFNYEDLWWSEDLRQQLNVERLEAGDVLIIPGRPKLYWENYLSLGLSILGVLLSVATIIITANK